MKKACIIFNKFYFDGGLLYIREKLSAKLAENGVELINADAYAGYGLEAGTVFPRLTLFFDKDTALAYNLESRGARVVNSAGTIEICDDKEKTYRALDGRLRFPKTIVSPLMYDINNDGGTDFLETAAREIGFPIILKHRTGSQGRQVFKADNADGLKELYEKNRHIPHLLQQFVGDGYGDDIRVYIIGGRAVAAVTRQNTTDFRSNVSLGGKMREITLDKRLKEDAETAAGILNLEYGCADFIDDETRPYFIEANTSPYMENAEKLGIPLSSLLASYIQEILK